MKNIFKFFGAFLTAVLTLSLTGCVDENLETADVGLHIKVFFPTKVVEGQPMTINGCGFSDATEIVFPGDVKVTDFQIVTNDMIRVDAPASIPAEGGHIIVRTADGEAESPLPLTLGNTVISGYSVQAGESIQGGQQMTIYGTDLEFINDIELIDADGNPLHVRHEAFYRKGTSSIIFTVPQNIFTGTFAGKVSTYDNKTFTMPEIAYEPAPTGYWEIVKTVIWKNPDPAGNGQTGWGGKYRFGLEGTDGNKECIAEIPAETWEKMKTTPFYMTFEGSDWIDMKVTSGWWNNDWTGANIQSGSERFVDNGDGTLTIEITLDGDPLKDVIDQQHLLFTGGGYTPLELYFLEEVWVEFGQEEPKEIVLWEGEAIADDWGNQPTLLTDAGPELVEAGATAGQTLYFYFEPLEDAWQVKIVEGHWGPTYAAICSEGNDNNGEFTPYDLAGNDGKFALELTQEILDAALTQQWWGGVFLLNGDNIKCTKLTIL